MRSSRAIRQRAVCSIAVGLYFVGATAAPATCQDPSGTAWSTIAGGGLGLYSGALLGTIGSLTPCTQTWIGPSCVRWSAISSGAVGLATGVAIGVHDQDRVAAAATGAGVGFALGLVAGATLKPIVQRFSWADVMAVGLVGAAIGAAPTGAAIGLAVGGTAGAMLLHRVHLPGAVGIAVGGLALGGLTEWVLRAAVGTADAVDEPRLVVPFAVSF